MTKAKYYGILAKATKPIFSNNDRKRHGIPLHRKTDRRRRYFTRNEPTETTNAFIDWTNHAE